MPAIPSEDQEELRQALHKAAVSCADRCLYQSAKWAAELLNSLPDPEPDVVASPADTEVDSLMFDHSEHDRPVSREASMKVAEARKYVLAKTYFDCREYDRCAAVFLPATLPKGSIDTSSKKSDPQKDIESSNGYPHLSQKALFLGLYAKYMSGEKRKDEESETVLGPSDGAMTVNRELLCVSQALESRFALMAKSGEEGDGWLEYLYGIVLAKGKNDAEAKRWLIKSVNQYAYNWGAWQELSLLIESGSELARISKEIPQSIMTYIFNIYANQELFQTQPLVFEALKSIKNIFPTSSFIRTQKALLCYHDRDYEKAERVFSKILQRDPLRIDSLDTYSNILFVMEKHPKLAFIAQVATATDKFRPETCCVVGNYYALKSEHEKAIQYFRRALTLDRNFQAAWTLMGHEYVELHNTHAAIECYRRAVDVNRKDFRAWYGLGQTYEILEMALYSLYYYERAAAACPQDSKMWTAVGSCLSKLNRFEQANKAYKRALLTGGYYEVGKSFSSNSQRSGESDRRAVIDPETLYAIAINYDRLGDTQEVMAYLELTLAQEEGPAWEDEEPPPASMGGSVGGGSQGGGVKQEGRTGVGVGVTATTSKARMWLAKLEYAKGDYGALRRAYEYANELCQDGWEVEEAKGLIKELRARMFQEEPVGWQETPGYD